MQRNYEDEYSNADFVRHCGDHTILIGIESITVWWSTKTRDDVYQDIEWSQEDEDAIIKGADPVNDGWEDGAGRLVCKQVAIEDADDRAISNDALMSTIAANLYDGGWRSGDTQEIAKSYECSERMADAICEWLEEIEREIAEE